jgi:hypothetical protein
MDQDVASVHGAGRDLHHPIEAEDDALAEVAGVGLELLLVAGETLPNWARSEFID